MNYRYNTVLPCRLKSIAGWTERISLQSISVSYRGNSWCPCKSKFNSINPKKLTGFGRLPDRRKEVVSCIIFVKCRHFLLRTLVKFIFYFEPERRCMYKTVARHIGLCHKRQLLVLLIIVIVRMVFQVVAVVMKHHKIPKRHFGIFGFMLKKVLYQYGQFQQLVQFSCWKRISNQKQYGECFLHWGKVN